MLMARAISFAQREGAIAKRSQSWLVRLIHHLIKEEALLVEQQRGEEGQAAPSRREQTLEEVPAAGHEPREAPPRSVLFLNGALERQ